MKSSNAKHHYETTKALFNIHDKIQNVTAFLKPKVSNTAQQPTFKAPPAGPARRGPPGPSRLPGRSHESQSTQSSSEETNSHRMTVIQLNLGISAQRKRRLLI